MSDLLEEEMSKEMSAPQPLQGEEHASVMGVTDQAPYAVGPARSTASFAVAGLLLSLGFVISFVSSLRHATIFFDTVKYQWGDGTGGKLHATFVVLGLVATPLVVASAAALLIPSLNRGLRALLSIVVIGVSGLLAVADIHMLVDPHNQYLRWFTDLRALMVWSDIVGREFEGLGDQGLTVNVWIALTLNVGLIGVMSIGWYRSARTRVRW